MSSESPKKLPALGAELRQARLAMGLTEQQVQRKLNISGTYLKDLESGDYDRFPAITFAKGYVKNYARLLNIPADDLLERYDWEREMANEPPPKPWKVYLQHTPSQWPSYMVLTVVLMLPFVWWQSQADSVEVAPGTYGLPPGVQVEAPLTGSEEGSNTESPALTDGSTLPPADITTQLAVAELLQEANPDNRLRIRFLGKSWLEVKSAAGETLFNGIGSPGTELELQSKGEFNLMLGDPQALMLSLNDKPVSIPESEANTSSAQHLTIGL